MTFLESTNPVVTISGSVPISSTDGPTPIISIEDATTDQKGAVQLEDSVTSTSVTKAATPSSVKEAYDYTTTVSGILQVNIDSKSGTFLELLDTPTTYSGHVGQFLKVALDGLRLEYTDIDGGTATTTISGWDAYDATTYYADFEHGLATDEISVFIIDTTTNKEVGVEDIEIISVNTIRVYVTDDTSSLKVNVITGGFVDTEHNHDDRYYTESEVDTISGSLQTNIDNKINTAGAIKWAIVFGGM